MDEDYFNDGPYFPSNPFFAQYCPGAISPDPRARTTTWRTPINCNTTPLRKRGSPADLIRHLPDFEASKRQKTGSTATTPADDFILISDDDEDLKDIIGNGDTPVRPRPRPAKDSETLPRPVDHLGRPLSDEALAAAHQYWDCQRKLDSCPFDEKSQGSALPFDLLLDLSWHRRKYTGLVLGLLKLEPGTRTYEPPYVEPLPPGALLPGQAHPTTVPSAATSNNPVPTPKVEPLLCPEQLELVELAASGRNIFYTGSAGCGKSTVLHAIRTRLRNMGRTVRVMAPTGKVALAINGTTTWTFAGWTPDHHKRELIDLERAANGRATRKRFIETDTIIIDEISMVENLHFERLNAVMKVGRSNDTAAFGGCQIIVTGDFCQLPPVKPFQHCIKCGRDLISKTDEEDTFHRCPQCKRVYRDSDKWAFRSQAWAECDFVHVHLKAIHRQSDEQFISMLQKCRLGDPFTQEEVDILMGHRSVTANAVKLFSTRDEVRRTNEEAFARLKTPPHIYSCFDRFLWDSEVHPRLEYKGQKNPDGSLRALDDHRFDRRLELKIGMLVVLLVNLDLTLGLCNGSQGIIAGFEEYDPEKIPRKGDHGDGSEGVVSAYGAIKAAHLKQYADQQLQENQRRGQKLFWPVVRFLNGMTMTIKPECQVHELGDKKPYSLLCRTQIPLAAAWALSIHKSQGMTLDRVVVNLSRAFEEGQVYVALSRATSLKGLKVEGDPSGLAVGRGGNQQVRQFLREEFGM